MFKVSNRSGKTVLTPDWGKSESKRLTFKGFKCFDEDSQYFYVALFCVKATECKKWTPFKDKRGGEYVEITEFTDPIFLRFLKVEIVYKGRGGKVNNIYKPTEWDEFFINNGKN